MTFLRWILPFGALVTLSSCAVVVVPASNDRPAETSVACAFGSQCESGACSADTTLGGCGHCLEAVPLGGACGTPYRGCGPHAACDEGICKTSEIPVGEPCPVGPKLDDLGRCTDDAFCAWPADHQTEGTCTRRAALGESCTVYLPGTPCLRGLACEGGVCIVDAPRKLGESCNQASCESPLYCESGVCASRQLMLGAGCGVNNGTLVSGACVLGLQCGNLQYPNGGYPQGALSTCLPLPKAGEPCIFEACDEGLVCERTTLPDGSASLPLCTRPHAEGEACGYSYDDPFGVCRAGLECRAQQCRPACR